MKLTSHRELTARNKDAAALFMAYISTSNITELQRLLSFPLMNFSEYEFKVPPVHICAASKNVVVLDFLLRNGFSVGTPDLSCNQGTILHRAAINGSEEVARIALQYGIDVNAVDKDGNTALHQAIYYNNLGVARLVLGFNPDTRILNKDHHSAFQIAMNKHLTEIAHLLAPVKYDWHAAKQSWQEDMRNNLLFNPDDLATKVPKVKTKKTGAKKGKKVKR